MTADLLQTVDLAQVDLRLDPAEASRVPFPLPAEPNRVWEDGPNAAIWLGPDEWLITGPPGTAGGLVTDLDQALASEHHSAIDVSANRATFEMTADDRLEIMAAGCTIDLHPRHWQAGMCAQTLIGKVPVVLVEREASTRIFVRPSYAASLADWLAAAAAGLREAIPPAPG